MSAPRLLRSIPSSGEAISALGLGTYAAFDIGAEAKPRNAASETLRAFAAAGGGLVDSSPMYGRAEGVIGDLAVALGVHDRLFLATKVWTRGRGPGVAQIEESFRLLRTERIDLLQVHNLLDLDVHTATLRALKAEGRIRYSGITHYQSGAHADLMRHLDGFDFVQVNYSLGEPEAERSLLAAAQAAGVAVLVNRPFMQRGLFARVAGKPLPPSAAALACRSWAQFFLKWILGHPAVTCVIPATRNAQHLAELLEAATDPIPDADLRRRMAREFAALV